MVTLTRWGDERPEEGLSASPKSPQDPEPSRLSHGSEEAGVTPPNWHLQPGLKTQTEEEIRAELEASRHHLPRVWVGEVLYGQVWAFFWGLRKPRGWKLDQVLYNGEVFTPGHQEKPTEDPREMKTIATCSVVDWT